LPKNLLHAEGNLGEREAVIRGRWVAARAFPWTVALALACVDSCIAADSTSVLPAVGGFPGNEECTLFPCDGGVEPFNKADTSDPLRSDGNSSLERYFANWSERVEEVRDSQPDWVPPLMTLSPLLTELVRWDGYYEQSGDDARVLNLGGGKGLFLVPTTSNEVDVGFPTYQIRNSVQPVSGLTDWQFLLIKQRLLSANQSDGNYIVTAAFAAQAPIGAAAFTNHAYVLTPALAVGKGFGDLDLQADTAIGVPTSNRHKLGTSWSTNATLQYRVWRVFWPEWEVNWTHWLGGTQRGGTDQVFLTAGVIVTSIPVTRGLSATVGMGYQFAIAPPQRLEPVQTPAYKNNLVLSARLVF
jgi:hypothetical protein